MNAASPALFRIFWRSMGFLANLKKSGQELVTGHWPTIVFSAFVVTAIIGLIGHWLRGGSWFVALLVVIVLAVRHYDPGMRDIRKRILRSYYEFTAARRRDYWRNRPMARKVEDL